MSYSNFLAQTRRELGEPSAGVWADESILWWANEAIRDIARQAHTDPHYARISAVVGQPEYSLPAGTTEAVAVFYGDTLLTRRLITDFPSKAILSQSGTPRFYIMDDSELRLVPTPDGTEFITFHRYRTPDAITADSDMPWGGAYDAAIRYFVKRLAMEQVSDWTAANEYAARYADELNKAITQESRERGSDIAVAPREVW